MAFVKVDVSILAASLADYSQLLGVFDVDPYESGAKQVPGSGSVLPKEVFHWKGNLENFAQGYPLGSTSMFSTVTTMIIKNDGPDTISVMYQTAANGVNFNILNIAEGKIAILPDVDITGGNPPFLGSSGGEGATGEIFVFGRTDT